MQFSQSPSEEFGSLSKQLLESLSYGEMFDEVSKAVLLYKRGEYRKAITLLAALLEVTSINEFDKSMVIDCIRLLELVELAQRSKSDIDIPLSPPTNKKSAHIYKSISLLDKDGTFTGYRNHTNKKALSRNQSVLLRLFYLFISFIFLALSIYYGINNLDKAYPWIEYAILSLLIVMALYPAYMSLFMNDKSLSNATEIMIDRFISRIIESLWWN